MEKREFTRPPAKIVLAIVVKYTIISSFVITSEKFANVDLTIFIYQISPIPTLAIKTQLIHY
jgi:hypothetical protein